MDKQKVIVYVDGFNFYYGLRKNRWRKYYWLDMVRLFESFMRPNQELVAVKYFSARVEDDGKSLRQNAFFQANLINPKFKLILGKYLRKTFKCKECGFMNDTYEEKESDVRIATQVVADALRKNCEISSVVSADSAMIPAMELAMEESHPVFAYFPPFQRSSAIASMFTSVIRMERYESRFRNSLLPETVTLRDGYELTIPEKWKAYQAM